jgi:phosphate transport system permease protein
MSNIITKIRRRKPTDIARLLLVWGSAGITVAVLLYLIVFVLIRGVPNITPSLFSTTYTVENQSLFPALVTTLIMIGFTLLIAVPFGVSTAIYLVEYAPRGSKLVRIIRMTTETLAGIPSIIFGLFG